MPSFKRTTAAAAVALSLWATPVSAEPVSTAISAIGAAFGAGGIFAQGTVLGFLARTAASMALSALANALARRGAPKPPGIKTEATTSGGTEPQTIILGRYATAGHHAAPPYSGRDLIYVVDIADMPITGINRVIINEEYVEWEPSITLLDSFISGDSKYVDSSNPGAVRATFYTGDQTEADPFLLDRFGNHPTRPWQADMVGTGIAYAVMQFRARRDVYSGLPRVRFEVDGAALYDPREDSSVGGDGPQRWDDPATWEFSQNPAVMIYNILRGITLPDGTVWGYEFDADDLPLSNWFAAMNECDVPVDLDGGGTEPQYRAGIEVKIGPQDLGGDAPADILEELLNSCSAEIAEIGGTVKIRVGAPTLPVLFITDDDIVVTSPDDYAPFPGLHETHNGVTATHPSPEALWEPVDAPPRYNADFEAEDADRRLVGDVTLNAVTSDTQVQRLMRAWVEDERRWRRHNITLSPRAAILEPLDTFEWTSERNGYLDKLFEARGVTHTRTLNQAVACRERDPSDYDWTSDFELPVVLPDPVSPLPDPDVPADWAAFPTVIKDASGGGRRPAIRLIWTQGENTDTTALEWQVRVAGQADLAAQGTTSDVALGEVIVSDGVLPGESYEARGRFVADRPMGWTAWTLVTTDDVRLSEADFAQAVRDRLSTEQERAGEAAARHDATLGAAEQSVGELFDEIDTFAFSSINELWTGFAERLELGAAIEGNTAAISSEQIARVTADEALVGDITQLEATVGDNSGAISTLQATKVDAAGAVSAVTQEISAEYGSLFALAEATSFAKATADGVVSGHILRATGSGASARFEIVAGDDVGGPASSIRLAADNIFLSGDTTVEGTFLTDVLAVSDEAYIDTANIVELNVGTANIVGTLSAQRVSVDGISLERDGDNLIVNDGGIGTPKIVGGAVSETRFASGNNSGGTVVSLSFAADEKGSKEFVLLISGEGYASMSSQDSAFSSDSAYRVLVNGNVVRERSVVQAVNDAQRGVMSDAIRFSANSGTVEVEDVSSSSNVFGSDAQIDNAQITLLELKR